MPLQGCRPKGKSSFPRHRAVSRFLRCARRLLERCVPTPKAHPGSLGRVRSAASMLSTPAAVRGLGHLAHVHDHPRFLALLRRLHIHPVWTPTEASWINLIEAQFGVL